MTTSDYIILGVILSYLIVTVIDLTIVIGSVFSERLATIAGINCWSDVFSNIFFSITPLVNIMVLIYIDFPTGVRKIFKPKHFL